MQLENITLSVTYNFVPGYRKKILKDSYQTSSFSAKRAHSPNQGRTSIITVIVFWQKNLSLEDTTLVLKTTHYLLHPTCMKVRKFSFRKYISYIFFGDLKGKLFYFQTWLLHSDFEAEIYSGFFWYGQAHPDTFTIDTRFAIFL